MLPRISSDSVKIISLDRNSLLERLREICLRLRSDHPEVVEVWLFGSLARGDQTGTSDIDVLIILDHATDPDPLRRTLTFLPYFDLARGTDLLIYTREEVSRRLSHDDRFLRRILRDGIPLE
jgi:predicted nucleotidyltransferase